jgi:hypothetical protein
LECTQGVFDKPDGNFERLLRTSQGLLTRLSEEDRYYRQWLGLFMILCAEEYQRFATEISPAEIKRLCQEQWEISPNMLSDRLVAEFREEFAKDALCYYLHVNSNIKTNKQAAKKVSRIKPPIGIPKKNPHKRHLLS